MSEPSAKIILDSISPEGVRLTTMECVMHRFVLAEFNTHRVFSRNSASSRAIPVEKQLKRVESDPAYPVEWPQEQSGMQGGETLSPEMISYARSLWELAADNATRTARSLQKPGVHKSVTNRLLEPFMWHTVIVTSTEWENFWGLRCSPMAQPEIRMVAEAMKVAFDASTPFKRDYEDWHAPYIQPDDSESADWRKVSAARCARVSYLTHDGHRDISKDMELYDRLVDQDPPHSSPLEHVATPARPDDTVFGNFRGWHQLRHRVEAAKSPSKAGREGESQDLPTANGHQDIQSQVIEDIRERREVGISRYGTALQPHNGRDALRDLYEELIDAAMYTKQLLVEQKGVA